MCSPMSWQRAFPSLVLFYAALLPPLTGCGPAALPAAFEAPLLVVGALHRGVQRCGRGEAVGFSSNSGWLTEGPRDGDVPGGGRARGGKGGVFADEVCRLRGGAWPGGGGGGEVNSTGSSIMEDFFSRPPAPGSSSAPL